MPVLYRYKFTWVNKPKRLNGQQTWAYTIVNGDKRINRTGFNSSLAAVQAYDEHARTLGHDQVHFDVSGIETDHFADADSDSSAFTGVSSNLRLLA